MPYIDPEKLAEFTSGAPYDDLDDPGLFAWAIATNVATYLGAKPLSYRRIGDMLAALEVVKAELIRRVVTPYEASKLTAGNDDPLELIAETAFEGWAHAMHEKVAAMGGEADVKMTGDDPDDEENPDTFPFPGENL